MKKYIKLLNRLEAAKRANQAVSARALGGVNLILEMLPLGFVKMTGSVDSQYVSITDKGLELWKLLTR